MSGQRAYRSPATAPAAVPLGAVLLLGPDPLLLAGIATLLRDALPVIVTPATHPAALAEPAHDVVVVDATSPSGAQALLHAASADGRPCVVLGAAGAPAVSTPSALLAAVARALGQADPAADVEEQRLAALSVREREVLDRTACGLSEAEVGHELGISPHTVRTHLRNASLKLGLRPQQAVEAVRRPGAPAPSVPQPYVTPALAPAAPLPLVLAARSPLRAAALLQLLREDERTSVVALATGAGGLDGALSEHDPRLGLVDVLVPDDGVLVRRLASSTACRVLAVGPADPDLARRALDAGALGYLPLGGPPADLTRALHALAAGEAWVPAGLLARVLTAQQVHRGAGVRAVRRLMRLTRGEREILPALLRGWSDERTAAALVVSPHTVRSHVQAALRKLEVPTRVELVALVREHDLTRLLEDGDDGER